MDEKEGERRLRVPYSKLEEDIATCLSEILGEQEIELTKEGLKAYAQKAVEMIRSNPNSVLYRGMVIMGMEIAHRMIEEDYENMGQE